MSFFCRYALRICGVCVCVCVCVLCVCVYEWDRKGQTEKLKNITPTQYLALATIYLDVVLNGLNTFSTKKSLNLDQEKIKTKKASFFFFFLFLSVVLYPVPGIIIAHNRNAVIQVPLVSPVGKSWMGMQIKQQWWKGWRLEESYIFPLGGREYFKDFSHVMLFIIQITLEKSEDCINLNLSFLKNWFIHSINIYWMHTMCQAFWRIQNE